MVTCRILLLAAALAVAARAGDLEGSGDGDGEERTPVTYEGTQVLRVFAVTEEQKKAMVKLEEQGEVDMWSSPSNNRSTVDIMVKPEYAEKVKDYLFEVNVAYDTMIENLQEAIDKENPTLSEDELSDLEGRNGHRLTWESYHRVHDHHGYMDYLEKSYPESCSVMTIGASREGRPIKVLKISDGNPGNPAIWIDGGIHAREWISPATVSYIAQELSENQEKNRAMLDGIDYYILPILNPDGYEYSHTQERMWRKNRAKTSSWLRCMGVDLNRNFGYHWGEAGSSNQPCSEIYRGTKAFSEPESQAVRDFVTARSGKIKAYLTFHSYGQYVLYPWGYANKVPPDHTDLQNVGRLMAQSIRAAGGPGFTVGSSAQTLYAAAGGSDDWAKGSGRIKYTYTIELRDTGNHGFALPASYIKPSGREGLAAVKTIAAIVKQQRSESLPSKNNATNTL